MPISGTGSLERSHRAVAQIAGAIGFLGAGDFFSRGTTGNNAITGIPSFAAFRGLDQGRNGQSVDARHGGNGFPRRAAFLHEDRPDEVVDRQAYFPRPAGATNPPGGCDASARAEIGQKAAAWRGCRGCARSSLGSSSAAAGSVGDNVGYNGAGPSAMDDTPQLNAKGPVPPDQPLSTADANDSYSAAFAVPLATSSAWVISARMSSICSMPMERRT